MDAELYASFFRRSVGEITLYLAQFQYIKLQPNSIDICSRLRGKTPKHSSYSPEPHTELF